MTSIFALLALVTALGHLGLLIAMHRMPNDYSPVRHAVSDYAVGPTRRLSTATTWLSVITWIALAVAIWTGLPGWSYRTTASVLLVVLGLIFIALPFVPTDLEGHKVTARGIFHYVLAIAWFAIAYSLTGDLSRYASAQWTGAVATPAVVLHWVALVSLIALVAAMLMRPIRRYFGLAERVFIVAISLFYLLIATGLIVD